MVDPASAAVVLRDVSKRYGTTTALRHCSFEVPAGSVTALVGPNGAGKSTLLSLIAGTAQPSSGTVWAGDAGERRVRLLSQDRPLYPSFAVRDMLELGRRLNTVWSSARAFAWLDRFEVPLSQRCDKLSGGQRTHVALALCVAAHPNVLLLDEPLANLDPLARRDTIAELLALVADDGLTMLLSTHVVAELDGVVDHLLLLAGGEMLLLGDVDTLLGEHRIVTGSNDPGVPGIGDVVLSEKHGRASRSLVRLHDGGAVLHPAWQQEPLTLEELIMGYLTAAARPYAAPERPAVPA
jgi:ABC-2 type transport system ATP-binding protein